MLKSALLTVAFVAAASTFATAEETIIKEKERPAVAVPVPLGPPVAEKRRIETTGQGNCESKSVTRENPAGSTTVKKERCD
jgi:hypothetical protein